MNAETNAGKQRNSHVSHVADAAINPGKKTVVTIEVKGPSVNQVAYLH
jgi:hypothetical protein